MLQCDGLENTNQSQGARTGECRDGHAYECHEELVEVVGEQAAAQPVAKSRADERANHVEGTAAKQEHEGCAGAGRGESRECRRIQGLASFDHVESFVGLANGDALRLVRFFSDVVEMLGVLAFWRLVIAIFARFFRGRFA